MIFEIDGDKLVLTAPNSFTLRIVQERFLQEISKRALPFFDRPPQIELRIEKRGAKKDGTCSLWNLPPASLLRL